jgi:MtN3 and saliva related transmembrane protein
MDIFFKIVGYIAATSSTISFVPQIISIIRTKDTKSISLQMYIIFVFGIICWLTYSIYIVDLPMLIANSVSLVFASFILISKIINVIKGKDSNKQKKESVSKETGN